MGTFGCNPDPRLTTAPQGWRAAACPILDVGLRKSCGTATAEDGTLRLWRGEAVAGGVVLLCSPQLRCGFWDDLGAQLEAEGSDKSLPFPKPQSPS